MSEAKAAAEVRASGVGRFIWYELRTGDVEAAKAFYEQAIGWGVDAFGGTEPYYIWTAAGAGIGGVAQAEGGPPHWISYLYVADVDGTLARAKELGGRVLVPATDIPGVGRYGELADLQGGTVAVMHPEGEDRPPEMRKVGHIGWHELHTTDAASAWSFYSGLFGWQHASEMDMGEYGRYSMFRHAADAADAWLGGLDEMAKHTHTPPLWLYYINVAAMAAALERIVAGGGKVANGPMEVPGGRAAQCLDPQGAMFGIFAQESGS